MIDRLTLYKPLLEQEYRGHGEEHTEEPGDDHEHPRPLPCNKHKTKGLNADAALQICLYKETQMCGISVGTSAVGKERTPGNALSCCRGVYCVLESIRAN